MSRQFLTATKGGINRLRVKGSPSPDTLFDALNCYVDASGVPQSRPGTEQDYALPTAIPKGLVGYNDGLVSFSHQVESDVPAGVSVLVLLNPNDATQPIREIHFAAPYMGFLYVAAEFENDDVVHYWLQGTVPWQPNTVYMLGDLVSPTTPNGLAYRATRLNPAGALWKPSTAYEVGDVVEPSVPNSFDYEAVDTVGINPRSGPTEPTWGTTPGALTNDDAEIDTTPPDTTGGQGNTNTPPQDVKDRYDNPSGNRPNTGAGT